MKLRSIFLAAAVAVAPIAAAPIAFADAPASTYTKRGDVAVSGYDPVAYFTVGEPTKGSTDFESTYKGATYRFASAENKATFDADPAAYAPQYGGYCAWAVAQGKTAPGNVKNWAIEDGKLYLNYNNGVQKKWNKDRAGFIQKANTEWPTLIGSEQGQGSGSKSSSRRSSGGYGS